MQQQQGGPSEVSSQPPAGDQTLTEANEVLGRCTFGARTIYLLIREERSRGRRVDDKHL